MRLRATMTFTYEADPENYGTTDVQKVAGLDAAMFAVDPEALADVASENDYAIEVVPA